jgi:putative CocE/NonD family hydrolase
MRLHRLSAFIAALVVGLMYHEPRVARAQTPAAETYDIKAHYSKAEYPIPMRDGVKLYTVVYTPRDTSQKYPILMCRTPYGSGPYGKDNFRDSIGPSALFMKEGYIVVYQDVRGQGNSGGKWEEIRPIKDNKAGAKEADESTDTYDTVEWLLKNIANNNGRVGMWGISYPGFYVSAGVIDSHPAIKAASPQAPVSDWFHGDDVHHNGCLFLAQEFDFDIWFNRPSDAPPFSQGTPNAYGFFLNMGPLPNADKKYHIGHNPWWNDVMAHPNYDAFWTERDILSRLKNVKAAVMTVGGWFDAEDLYGALHTPGAIAARNPGAVSTLVMGPWLHGGWSWMDGDRLGDARFGEKTGVFYREKIELPFFNHYLKDKGDPKLPAAYVYETGANRWRQFAVWPPKEATERAIYLQPNSKLTFDAPVVGQGSDFDEYISDPAKPVPFSGRVQPSIPGDYMLEDQRFAATRTDVMVYESEPLADDLTIAGPVTPSLYVSTSGTDSDYVVKLIDVSPEDTPSDTDGFPRGGYEMMIRGEPMRARFRNSFEKPEPMPPGKPVKVEFVMPDVLHTFRKGHRIMVQVQSSWFPLVDRNPQTFVPSINAATDADFKRAAERIYHTPALPSCLKVRVLPSMP